MKSTATATGVFLWALLLFLPCVMHPFVMWDDPAYVMLNPLVHHWVDAPWHDRILTPELLYPVPFPVAVYAAFSAIFGDYLAPAIHLLSALLHGLNAVLLFSFCRRLTAASAASVIAALLWASHPLMVESVAWATNLKELLMTAAILGSLLIMTFPRKRLLWLIPVAFLGFAAKPTFAVVGGLLMLVAWRERDLFKGQIAAVLAATGLAYIVWTSAGHGSQFAAAFEARDTMVTIGKAAGLQVVHGFWPVNLQPYYPLDLQEHDALSLTGWVVLGASIVITLRFFRRREVWTLGVSLALTAWLPYSNLLPLPRFTADTYAYLPGIGVALTIAALLQKLPSRQVWLGIAVAACFAMLSLEQASRWASTKALWTPLLGQPDRLALPYGLIAFEAHLLGDNERAAELLEQAWPQIVSQTGRPGFAENVYKAVKRQPPK